MDETAKQQFVEWVRKVFAVVGVNAPEHIVVHYVHRILKGKITPQQVQEEVLLLCKPQVQNAPSTPPTATPSQTQSFTPTKVTTTSVAKPPSISEAKSAADQMIDEEKLRIQAQIGTKTNSSELEKIKEYVNQLYITYTGKKGDPASVNYLINNINDKSFTLTQAEYFVKFSKEAKAYAQVKAQKEQNDKLQKIHEYVVELFRVYMKKPNPSQADVQQYVDMIVDGSSSLQDVEDEIRLLSIAPPK